MTPKRGGYAWVTWLTGVLAGDDSCRWAPWVKTNFSYEKRPDDNAETLATWKTAHAALVARRVDELRANGWIVTVEDQNEIKLKGRRTNMTLAGKPDIVAVQGLDVLVVDAKTGQRRGKDIWQVRIYQMALPMTGRFPADMRYFGEVAYPDGNQPVAQLEPRDRQEIVALLAEIGGSAAPEKVPSARECRFCPIAECAERVVNQAAPVETGAF